MKKLLIPTMIFPYFVCFCLACLFSATAMNKIFFDNLYAMMISIVVLWLASCICSFIYVRKVRAKKRRSKKILKELMFIKYVHIPAYIIIAFGELLLIVNSAALYAIDLIVATFLGLVAFSVASGNAIYRMYKHKRIDKRKCTMGILSQFVFVLDIVGVHSMYEEVM